MAKKSKVKKQSYDQMMASSSKATSYEGMMANKDRYSQKNNLSVLGKAIDNMNRQRQQAESDSRTKAWQQATANMRYSPNGDQSWQAYAAKMISDTPGALDRIRQREQQATENRTKAWQDYARNATYAGQPEMAYGHKAILDTPIRESNRKIYGSEEQAKKTELSQFLYGLAQKRKEKEPPKQTLTETKSVQGYETWRENNLPAEEKKKNQTALKPYLDYLGDTYKGIQAGRFDSEDDYRGWSDKKLAAEIQKKQNETQVKQAAAEEQLRQRIAEQPGEIFGSLFADDPDRGWITDQASGYFTHEMPGMFNEEDTPEDKRRITYDRIMKEEDAYDTRTAGMTPQERAAFDETLDRAIQRAENPTAEDIEYHGWTPESGEAFHEARTDDGLLKKYQDVYDARQKVTEMMAAAPEGTFEKPQQAKPQGGTVLQKMFSSGPQIKDEADKAYWEIRNQQSDFYKMSTTEKMDYLNKMGISPTGGGGLADSLQDTVNAQGAYYAFMTPEMVDTFNRYYESGDKQSAMAFLSAVEGTGYLQACAAGYREWVADANARGDYGLLYGLATVPDQLLTSAAGMIGTAGAMFGNKELADPNNELWSHQSDIQTTRQARGDVIADTAANAYKNVQKWILSNLGGDAGRAVANSDTMLSHFSDWVKDPAKFLTNVSYSILDNMAAMGVGKFFGGNNMDSVMRTVQWIMSSEATSNTMMQKLKDGYSPTEAAIYAFGDGIIEAITEKYSLEALLKPDVKGMLGNGKELSKFLLKTTIAEGSEEIASDALNTGLDYVLSVLFGHENEIEEAYNKLIAQDVKPEEALRQVWMQKFEQMGLSGLAGAASGFAMGAGRVGLNQISNKVTGQSIRNNKIEYNGKHGINAILDMAMNMPEGSNSAERAAKLIEQVNNGVEVSDREIGKLATLMQAEAAETIEKANSGEEVAQEDIDKSMKTLRSVAAIVENRVEEIEKPSKETTGLQLASPEDIEEAERNGSQRTGSRMEVIYDGKFANLDKAEAVEGKDGGLMFRLEGMAEPVSADQIQATDFQTAAIIRQAAQNQGFYSSKYTNRLLQAQRDGRIRNVSTFLNDAMLVRLSGYTGMQMPQHSMNQTLANELRMDAMEEHATNRKKQLEGANRKTEGRVTYKGAEYGSEEWKAAVKSLDKNLRNQMDAIAAVAQRAGIEVSFMDLAETEQGVRAQGLKDNPRKVYGWENRDGISVNVEGLDYGTLGEETGRHNMAVTFGHEMTHWLQRNSMKGYNRLEQYVMNDYAQRNGAMRLMANLNRYMNDGLNLEDAMSEMVANSCDQILGDEKVAEHIQNTDKSLYNEIKGFVQDLVNRVKTAITGMESSASEESKALLRTANRLAEVWLGAYDEAISGAINEGTGAAEDITRMSKAQLDRAYDQALADQDVEQMEALVRQAAELAGYNTPKLFHGTRFFGFTEFDVKKGEGLIFATSDRKVAESYSGETKRSRIFERNRIDANNLHGNRLLKEAQKYFRQYEDYKLMSQKDRAAAIEDAKMDLSLIVKDLQDYLADNESAFDDEKLEVFNRMVGTLESVGEAKSQQELMQVWDAYESAMWDMKFMDEDRLDDMMGVGTRAKLDRAKNWLRDLLYDGELFVNKYTTQMRVYDKELAIEVNAKMNQGVYELYGKTDNQLVIDAGGSNWNQIMPPAELNMYGPQRTRAIAEAAYAHGYDSVLIQNVKDSGGETPYNWPSNVYIYFNGNQVKSADPVTYDENNKPIKLSERFKDNQPDIRYSRALTQEERDVVRDFVAEKKNGRKGISRSENGKIQLAGAEIEKSRFSRWTEESMDVNAWLAGATESTFQTEDERVMWQAWKDLRMKIQISLKRQLMYQDQIRALEKKAELTKEERDQLTALQNKLEVQRNKMARLEDDLQQVTSSEGYAGMMYRNNVVLGDYITGKTQDQVRDTVEQMVTEVQKARGEIAKQAEELKKLAQSQAVKSMQSFFGKTSLKKMAYLMKKNYGSTMQNREIEARLAEMAMKQASGVDITDDCAALAQDLVDKIRGIRSEALEQLRGMTFVIGENLAKELKAENTSLQELRRKLKGSGVKFVTNTKNQDGAVVDKHSRIAEQWEELRDQNQGLPDVSGMSEIEKLHTIADFIENEMARSRGAEQFGIDMDEAALFVRSAVGNVTTYLVDNPAARRQIENLMRQIQDLSGKTGKIAVNMDELSRKMEEVENAGIRARGWTTVLQRDVKDAINYYNKMAGVAARQEKQKVKEMIIDQLKGENTKKLIAQQEKYEKLMKDSEKARNLAQDNMTLRGKIQTVATRMGQRLFAETDTKNIPEEAKPLARFVLGMLEKHDDAFRHILLKDKKTRVDVLQRLMKMDAVYGPVDIDNDLNWLIVNPGPDQDTSVKEAVEKALQDIEMGMMEYRNAEGQGTVSLMDRKAALEKVQEAVSKIWSVIRARSEMDINGRKWQVMEVAMMMDEGMRSSKYKGERFGFGSKARNAVTSALNYGNLTPEYFIKNLKNAGLNLLKKGLDSAEQRWGLTMARAKQRVAQIAEETGYKTWDGKEKHQVQVNGNRTVEMTTEQIMSLYATWKRESNALRPEETAHLLHGGFVLTQEDDSRKPRRARVEQRPIRITKDCLNGLRNYLTDQQAEYVDQIVAYMSGELAEIGNEASMQMYGIKKFTEQFYFPIKSWGGVLNQKSDAGVKSNSENRAAQQGFSKRVRNNAANAIEIGDFTATAMNHIAGMINYNTIAPAVENMNKVLNQQYTEGEKTETEDERFTRNMRARFQEYYGKQAYDYLAQYMQDLNGGLARRKEVLLREKLLSLFKKNAVAGSLSVAAQQPLSYIRAAEMISPKYLAAAISPQYWKGSYKEMMKHSGLAVIKEMGKFDMDYGRTAVDYITPEGMTSKTKAAWDWTTDKINILPQKMDAMTWTRMWTACKLEQMALHRDMDHKSDEFMELVAERFNELMRRTQVYDSVTVKSQNMRSDNYLKKVTTSFMAEPTLTLNVLADAWQNRKDKGGMKHAIKSLVLFAMSAAAQAGAKAFFGTGRSPDKKKNQEENFLNKYGYNILSEANPLSLIPGYSQMMDVLMNGELNDDAMGVIGKAKEAFDNIKAMMTGDKKGTYRNLEDSVGQLIQFATDVPAKNFMRDFRAMVNWFSGGKAVDFTGDTYANRATSGSVLKYQLLDTWMSDDLIGLINNQLGAAGYGTDMADYIQRIYDANKAGQKEAAKEMREYIVLAKSKAKDPEGEMDEALRKLVKKDDSLTAEEKYEAQKEYGLKKGGSFIMDEYKAGRLNRKDAERLYRKENPKATDKKVMEALDKVEWEKAGNDGTDYSNYTPLYTAIADNKSDEIKKAVKYMTDNGYKQADIKEQLRKKYRESYLAAKGSDRTRLEDALTKAYKAIGLTAEDAIETINSWTKEEKKEGKPSSSGGRIASAGGMSFSGNQGMKLMEQNMYANTEGELYGKGNIDLNHRKTVRNDDGSISTELSLSFYDEDSGKEVLIPTVVNGRIVSEEEAIDHYYETGEYLGRFNTPEEADAYAELLHNRQDWYYNEYRNR